MRIDAHQHFWRYDPREYGWIDDSMAALRRDFLPPDLHREMTGAGFDACVAVQARQTLEETRWLLALADAYPFIAGVVGWVDLQAPDARAQIEQLAAHPKLVGVRHIVQSEPDDRFLLRPDFGAGLALLAEFGLAYDLLIYSRHLPVATELAGRLSAAALRPRPPREAGRSRRRDSRLVGGRAKACRLSERLVQAVGAGHGGGLGGVDAGAAAAVSRRRVRWLWRRSSDDWFGLARLHGSIGLRAHDGRGRGVSRGSARATSATPCSAATRSDSGTWTR